MSTRSMRLADGSVVEAEYMGVVSSNEPWGEYLLVDGTVIKSRVIALEILRIPGRYDGYGNPQYITATQVIVHANAPDSLRRPV